MVSSTVALLLCGCHVQTSFYTTAEPEKKVARHHKKEKKHGKQVAGPIQREEKPTVHLTLTDALGKPVRLEPDQPHVAVVYLADRQAKDELEELATQIDQRLVAEPIEQVVIIDLHNIPGVMRHSANAHMKKAAERSLAKRRERREAHHVDASEDTVKLWHLVADYDQRATQAFGVDPSDHAQVFVVDKHGHVSGPYQQADRAVDAVHRAEQRQLARARRHKSSETAKR